MREVADAAGVHFTTVSRALRNHPGLPAETRERIQKLAAQMGYNPDPILSALNNYRVAQRRIVSYQGTIAWLDGFPDPKAMQRVPALQQLYEAACQRATELGYKLESFWLGSKNAREIARLDHQLKARGVRNVLISSQFHAGTRFDLNWDNYSVVSISLSFANPRFCTVVTDHYGNAVLLTRRLRELGYRRIGLLLEDRLLAITERRWLAGYLVERSALPADQRLEILSFDENVSDATLQDWYRRNRPDALITEPAFARKRLQPLLGLNAPRNIGLAYLALTADSPFAGIVENSAASGRSAIEQLVKMDQHSERGPLEAPVRLSIPGDWKDGNTVRKRRATKQ